MHVFLIQIQGSNFRSTLYDTDDLSTIRGASRAYLDLTEYWFTPLQLLGEVELIVRGASDAVYRLTVSDDVTVDELDQKIDDIIRRPAPAEGTLGRTIPHLTFTWAVIEEGADYKTDLLRLLAISRARRLHLPSVDFPKLSSGEWRRCSVDKVRPASGEPYHMPDGVKDVSASVRHRRDYGREVRQRFYEKELDKPLEFDFVNDLETLAAPVTKLVPAVRRKMAVIYFDGNKFTGIRDSIVFEANGNAASARDKHKAFSDFLRAARRDLLASLLAHCAAQPQMFCYDDRQEMQRLRFETLLWGGDEAMFVVPAWIVLGALQSIASSFDRPCWLYDDKVRLSHSVGIVICNYKTPIAVAQKLAKDIADEAKPLAKRNGTLTTQENVYSLQVLESIEPPREDLADFREELYGTRSVRPFALKGREEVQEFIKPLDAFRKDDGGLPRSQLFGLIAKARTQGLFQAEHSDEAAAFLEREVQNAFERCRCTLHDRLMSPALGYSKESPLLPLIRLAEFWDYVEPFADRSKVASLC